MKVLVLVASLGIAVLGGCDCDSAGPGDAADAGQDGGPPAPDCARDNGGCDANAKCIMRASSRLCICNPWYFGDGLTCAKSGLQVGSPWPMEGGNVRHTGQSIYVGPQTKHLKWSKALGDSLGGTPAIDADGTVYVGAPDELHAYRADGTLKEVLANGRGGGWSTPALGADGALYVQNGGMLHAVDIATTDPTKRVKWPPYSTKDRERASPTIGADGTVYIGSLVDDSANRTYTGMVYALDPATGSLKWPVPFISGPMHDSSPAIGADGTLFVATDFGMVFAIGADGKERWHASCPGGVLGVSPVIGADGTVFVGGFEGTLYAFNAATGAAKSLKVASSIRSLAVGADGTLYVGGGRADQALLAIDPATIGQGNKPLWSFPTKELVDGVAIGADGTVYLTSDQLYALKPDGSLKWSDPIFGPSSPVLGDGVLYVRAYDGSLNAFGD
jgi:outer membrane protein assembly factor BamB